ncbi:MAG: putative metal-dependent hydrolase [Ignavibacteriales bacterium]|nr:putative metal-dependent hydrolase [Ignavibacteriales bacterium]
MTVEELKYPLGKFVKPDTFTPEILNHYIRNIESFPSRLRAEVEHLTDEQLDTHYRPGGWTIRQVVNHCADSHMNSFMRFKLALTEDTPTIKPYFENRWAELADSKSMPIEPALKILEGLHQRWVVILKSLTKEELGKRYIHPEHGKELRLDTTIGIYAWHCNHHLAHITTLKKTRNWE